MSERYLSELADREREDSIIEMYREEAVKTFAKKVSEAMINSKNIVSKIDEYSLFVAEVANDEWEEYELTDDDIVEGLVEAVSMYLNNKEAKKMLKEIKDVAFNAGLASKGSR